MALEPNRQFAALIDKAQSVLILTPQNPSADAVAAARAMYFFLEKRKIEAAIASVDEAGEGKKLDFLPRPEKMSDNIFGSQDFLLLFNTKFNNITDVRTERAGDEFRIFITPEKGSIDPRDFSFVPAKFKYDLLVILGAADKESVGKIYADSPDIFFEVPIVNIDCQNANENFGQVNLVDILASSVSEVLAETLLAIAPEEIEGAVSEYLLAGIIIETESFQKRNTTPRSLQTAARLMEKGADQQKINRYLFKTQPLNLLKLWGRAMVRLNWDEELGLAWSEIGIEDFVQSRTLPSDLPFVLDKLQDNYSAGKIFAVFFEEKPGTISAVLKFSQPERLKKAAEKLEGNIERDRLQVRLSLPDTAAAVREVTDKLKD